MTTSRRALLAASASASAAALVGVGGFTITGCSRRREHDWDGGWVGASVERGHLLRSGWPDANPKSGSAPPVAATRGADALVVGAGVSGLAAARALVAAGIGDTHLLELEDAAGGNARGHAMAGMRCPLGAHYLPVPGAAAVEVIELLDALGVRRRERGAMRYDEAMLCHAPQERLWIRGGWRDGLLPPLDALPAAERASTLADYRRFEAALARVVSRSSSRSLASSSFAMPTARAGWNATLAALDAASFAAWLDANGIATPALRWYLDYCCRDDYGAGAAQVSAWAGLHYFASRHGFRAPGGAADLSAHGADSAESGDGILTWPEGNGWLTARMAEPLAGRIHSGRVVLSVEERRDGVVVDAWNVAGRARERWQCRQLVLATPLFVSARLLRAPPPALVTAAAQVPHAPWLVANLHLATPLDDRPGAPLSWDNVVYGSPALGYVDAMHQSLRPYAGATVLTAYWALGGDSAAARSAGRARLLADDWPSWAARVVADLVVAHPDLPERVVRVDAMRYGHAMAIPVPGVRGSAALAALAAPQARVHHAHSDLSGYSMFEEAMYQGTRAGRDAAMRLGMS